MPGDFPLAEAGDPVAQRLLTESSGSFPLGDLPSRINAPQRAMLHYLIPGLYDYFSQPTPPPQITPNAAGKVPPADYNPNVGPALQDVTNVAMLAAGAPELRGMLSAAEAGRAAAPAVAEAGRAAYGRLLDLFPSPSGAAGGAGAGAAMAPPSSSAGDKTRVAATPAAAAIPPANQLGVAPPSPQPSAPPSAPPSALQSMRPTFTGDDLARLAQLDKDVTALSRAKQDAINSVGRSRIASTAQTYDDQIKGKQNEIAKMRNDMLDAQSAFDRATMPITVRNPDAVAAARATAMGAGVGTGFMHGLAHKPGILPWIGSGILGALEGSAGVVAPNLLDLGQPPGTPARDVAEKNLSFATSRTGQPGAWDYAGNVIAPEALGGAIAGVTGHGIGHGLTSAAGTITRGVRSLFAPVAPVAPPVAAPIPAPAPPPFQLAEQGRKVWPNDYRQIDMAKDKNGGWFERGTGHKVPSRLWPPDSAP